jgi:hypothetical protein
MNKKKSKIFVFFLVILGLLPLKDFFTYRLFDAHDIVCHTARLASFFQSLSQGNFLPRWGGNLNYDYGHPVLMFLFPLQNYLGSVIHFLGFDFVDSIKIIFILSYLFSSVLMYLWVKDFWGKLPAFVAATFFLFAPYRFVNLYVRGALGEHLALSIVPLVFFAIYRLVKFQKIGYLLLVSLSLAALITAHNAVSLMFLPIIFLYSIFLSLEHKNFQKKTSFLLFLGIVLGFCLSAFFWFPAFFEGKYTLRDIVTTPEIYENRLLTLKQLFYSPWGYGAAQWKDQESQFTVQVGLAQWLVLFLNIILVLKLKRKLKKGFNLVLLAISSFILSCFLSLKNASFLIKFITILARFQFPFRMLSLPVFSAAILAASLIKITPNKIKKMLIIVLIIFAIIPTIPMWKAKGEFPLKDTSDKYFLTDYTGTTETGESTPRWTIRFMEQSPPQKIQTVNGEIIKVEIRKWLNNLHEYSVKAKVKSQIADNTLYFPGWKVWVNGKLAPIEFQDQNWRGIITFPVPEGKSDVKVKFTETKLRLFADLISLFSLFSIIFIICSNLLAKFFKNEKDA